MRLSEDLRDWFREKWVDISKKDASGKHPPCGRSKSKKKGYPKCRPSVRVSSKTPETTGEMSQEEKKKAVRQKRMAEKKKRKGKKPHVVSHLKEDFLTEGDNKPTNSKLWSRAKSLARKKFKVYPSAYANAWAAKWYKKHGGGWTTKGKTKNESYKFLVNYGKNYLIEKYGEDAVNLSEDQILNEFLGTKSIIQRSMTSAPMLRQLGAITAAQAMKTPGGKGEFIKDIRQSLRGESGLRGMLTRLGGKRVEDFRIRRRVAALDQIKRDQKGLNSLRSQIIQSSAKDQIKTKAERILDMKGGNDAGIRAANTILNRRGLQPRFTKGDSETGNEMGEFSTNTKNLSMSELEQNKKSRALIDRHLKMRGINNPKYNPSVAADPLNKEYTRMTTTTPLRSALQKALILKRDKFYRKFNEPTATETIDSGSAHVLKPYHPFHYHDVPEFVAAGGAKGDPGKVTWIPTDATNLNLTQNRRRI